MSTELRVHASTDALMHAAAEELIATAKNAVDTSGRFAVALAGGNTPRQLYTLLAGGKYAPRIAWASVEVLFGDERCVPPDHDASNYRMANEALLAHVPLDSTRVHRIRGEDAPSAAAAAYERTLRTVFATPTGPPQATAGRCLDLVLLGMGDDGHTASLFPHAPTLGEREGWAVPAVGSAPPKERVTLTAPMINAARQVMFLVVGASKATTLRRVLEGPRDPEALPAQLVAPVAGRLTWMVDRAAAAALVRA